MWKNVVFRDKPRIFKGIAKYFFRLVKHQVFFVNFGYFFRVNFFFKCWHPRRFTSRVRPLGEIPCIASTRAIYGSLDGSQLTEISHLPLEVCIKTCPPPLQKVHKFLPPPSPWHCILRCTMFPGKGSFLTMDLFLLYFNNICPRFWTVLNALMHLLNS